MATSPKLPSFCSCRSPVTIYWAFPDAAVANIRSSSGWVATPCTSTLRGTNRASCSRRKRSCPISAEPTGYLRCTRGRANVRSTSVTMSRLVMRANCSARAASKICADTPTATIVPETMEFASSTARITPAWRASVALDPLRASLQWLQRCRAQPRRDPCHDFVPGSHPPRATLPRGHQDV